MTCIYDIVKVPLLCLFEDYLQEFESYSVMAVRHKVTHLHNVRPWAVIRAVRGRPITKDCAI